MRTLKALLVISGTVLIGCATTPEWNAEAAESVRPMRDVHMACMLANASSIDDGTRDPADIVATIEGLCAPLLEPMRAYIAQDGYGESVADAHVELVMTEARRAAEDTLLRVRTEARKDP